MLDLSGPVGSAAVQAPSLISFVLTIHGKAAHAGFEPEKGIHAVTAAALAIARLPQGHLEEDTTLNIGLIRGGTATNIVPESCIETLGGSDFNTFAEHGIRGIVLSCGMYQPHSTREYTTVEDLEKGAALVEELILGE